MAMKYFNGTVYYEDNFWAIGRCPDDPQPTMTNDLPVSWRPWQGSEQNDEHVLDYWRSQVKKGANDDETRSK